MEVARAERLVEASKRLGVDASTVSRRLYRLEKNLDVHLFIRTMEGHTLTEHGKVLFEAARQMESQTLYASEVLQGKNLEEVGSVRVGTTEAFGTFFLTPKLAEFTKDNRGISIELLPMSRAIRLTKHEADMSISLEKSTNNALIVSKLCNYRLKMYATKDYIRNNQPITSLDDLRRHPIIGYISNLAFSKQLHYLDQLLPDVTPTYSSTSVIAQYMFANEGTGLAILPCFLARHNPELVPILEDEISILRSFWLIAHPERKKLARVNKVWQFFKEVTAENADLMLDK
jgi:DNA-binding transcriptional LysR family regulator